MADIKVLIAEKDGVELDAAEEHLLVAGDVPFNNSGTTLTSQKVQDAIAELASNSKAGQVLPGFFSGTPKKAVVTFDEAFPDNNYSVTIEGSDGRVFVPESVTAAGFTINSQANAALAGVVYWTAKRKSEG